MVDRLWRDIDDHAVSSDIAQLDRSGSRRNQFHPCRRDGERDGRDSAAESLGGGVWPEHDDASDCEGEPQHHRASTLKVTVAAYRPVATSGNGDENPIRVAQTSPATALGAFFVPTVSAAAG